MSNELEAQAAQAVDNAITRYGDSMRAVARDAYLQGRIDGLTAARDNYMPASSAERREWSVKA